MTERADDDASAPLMAAMANRYCALSPISSSWAQPNIQRYKSSLRRASDVQALQAYFIDPERAAATCYKSESSTIANGLEGMFFQNSRSKGNHVALRPCVHQ